MGFSGRTDGELLALFTANGNQAALEEIIRRHAPMVRTVCRRAARRLRDCDDMMQSVFVALARRAPDLLGYVSLAGWLYRTAWYTARRACRASSIRRLHKRQAAEVCMQIRQENAERERMREEVHRILELLPEPYREALILHHIEGWTVEEAAQLMGIKTGTAAARLSRGRKMLQDRLEEKGFTLGSATALTLLMIDENSSAALPGELGAGAFTVPKAMAGGVIVGESGGRLADAVASAGPAASSSGMPSGTGLAGGVMRHGSNAHAGVGAACIPTHGSAAAALAVAGCGIAVRNLARAAVIAGMLMVSGGAVAASAPQLLGWSSGGPSLSASADSREDQAQAKSLPSDEWGSSSSGWTVAVPEPGTLGMIAGAAMLLIRRRR